MFDHVILCIEALIADTVYTYRRSFTLQPSIHRFNRVSNTIMLLRITGRHTTIKALITSTSCHKHINMNTVWYYCIVAQTDAMK